MNDLDAFNAFAKGKKDSCAKQRTRCVIYTRVSTKEQADNNLSLETQRKSCELYAQKLQYAILEFFGGTYESAQTDERKEFKRMIDFCKLHKEEVACIIVHSLERFSRTGAENAIWLVDMLRKMGISLISATQPIDASQPSGELQQNILLLFGKYDNDLRKQKCVAGTKERLLTGEWVTKAPVGYDHVRSEGKRLIVVNEKGKLLKKAFLWKANEDLPNEIIRQRLAALGLSLSKQRLSEILRNPFYCGLLIHRALEGKVVMGNQEQVISKEIFLKSNKALAKNSRGFKWKKENDFIPLKHFAKCDVCGVFLTGYEVKSKKYIITSAVLLDATVIRAQNN
jgi:site-specific DNA recombinase